MKRFTSIALIPLFALVLTLNFASPGIADEQVAVGDPAPGFALSDPNGQLHSLAD